MFEQLPGPQPNQNNLSLSLGFAALYATLSLPVVLSSPAPTAILPIVQALLLAVPLIAMSVIDCRSFRLPDTLTVPLLALGLARTLLVDPTALPDHGLAAALGYLLLAGIAYVYFRLRGREGLGMGDAKLLGASGAWLGTDGLISSLLLASLSAMLVVLSVTRVGRSLSGQTKIAFGPFLALGLWLTWLYGPLI